MASCLYCCCGIVVVLVNIIQMIIGLALLAIGVLLKLANGPIFDMVKKQLSGLFKNLNIGELNIDIDKVLESVFNQLSTVAIALIIIGCILLTISLLSFCSICCKYKVLLIIYIVIIAAILIALIVIVALYGSNDGKKIKEGLADVLQKMIETKYEGIKGQNIESQIINLLQINYHCCGVNNYQDFEKAKSWAKNAKQDVVINGQTYKIDKELKFPLSCCDFKDMAPVNFEECFKNDKSESKDTGCISKLYEDIKKIVKYFIFGGVGIILFEALVIVAAILCLISMKSNKVE